MQAKYFTPHLVGATRFDEDGSQTNLRLQPRLGFYLDDTMRADEGLPIETKSFTYFLHVLGGPNGIKDLREWRRKGASRDVVLAALQEAAQRTLRIVG